MAKLHRPEDGTLRTDPYLYLGGDQGDEIRHLLERSSSSFQRLFTGSSARPIIHAITKTKPEMDPHDVEQYRAYKISVEGWHPDMVDAHLNRLHNPVRYSLLTREDGTSVLHAQNDLWGSVGGGGDDFGARFIAQFDASDPETTDPAALARTIIGGWGHSYPDRTDVPSSLLAMSEMLAEAKLPVHVNASSPNWSLVQALFADLGWVQPTGQARHPDLVKVNLKGTTNDGQTNSKSFTFIKPPELKKALGRLDGILMPTLDITCVRYSSSEMTLQAQMPVIVATAEQMDALFSTRLSEAHMAKLHSVRVDPLPYTDPRTEGDDDDEDVFPLSGFLITMPDGVADYRLEMRNIHRTIVSGVDAWAASHISQSATVLFPMIADHIQAQVDSGVLKGDDLKAAQDAIDQLKARPEGAVSLVWYSGKIPLPYEPLERLPAQRFARRAGLSIAKYEIAPGAGVTWGQAQDRVHKKGASDTFAVIHSSVLDRIDKRITPFVGSAHTHHIYFATYGGRYDAYLVSNESGLQPGDQPLSDDDVLTYSQLGYPWRYDGYLQTFENPQAEVLRKRFPDLSAEDLVVQDPTTGEALKPDEAMDQRVDITDFYEDGYLTYSRVPEADRPLVALINQGMKEPEDMITMVKQMLTQGYAAMVARLDTFPNLDAM